MEFHQLQTLGVEGHLIEAAMTSSRKYNGWMIEFEKDDGEMVFLTRHDGRPYAFRDLDRATKMAKQFGFSTVRIAE